MTKGSELQSEPLSIYLSIYLSTPLSLSALSLSLSLLDIYSINMNDPYYGLLRTILIWNSETKPARGHRGPCSSLRAAGGAFGNPEPKLPTIFGDEHKHSHTHTHTEYRCILLYIDIDTYTYTYTSIEVHMYMYIYTYRSIIDV